MNFSCNFLLIISRSAASNSSTSSETSNSSQQNNNGWSFEEQFKQVRQVKTFSSFDIRSIFENFILTYAIN